MRWDSARGLHQGQQSFTGCINRPNRELHPTLRQIVELLLQRGSHPQKASSYRTPPLLQNNGVSILVRVSITFARRSDHVATEIRPDCAQIAARLFDHRRCEALTSRNALYSLPAVQVGLLVVFATSAPSANATVTSCKVPAKVHDGLNSSLG